MATTELITMSTSEIDRLEVVRRARIPRLASNASRVNSCSPGG